MATFGFHHGHGSVPRWPIFRFRLGQTFGMSEGMALLPDRYPQRDFFMLDIVDAVPKDDMASMEHPIFSISMKPDHRTLRYRNGKTLIEIRPSALGLPTIKDKDILIFVISQLMAKRNQGQPIKDTVTFPIRELCIAINRPIGGDHYKRIAQAIDRLQGTQFVTNIETGGQAVRHTFSMIDQGSMVKNKDFTRNAYCQIKISDWLMRAIESDECLTISRDYFRIKGSIERRLYEIARKHCGRQRKWQIGLDKLQAKTGSNAPLKKFRLNLRQIIAEDVTPDYRFELDGQDIVTIRPRKAAKAGTRPPDLSISEKDEDEARRILTSAGLDYQAVRAEWIGFALEQAAQGKPPKRPGLAFVGFCKKQVAG